MPQFVPYGDRSSAKRGLGRKFPDYKTKADNYLSQRDGKWGFLTDEKGLIAPFEETTDSKAEETIPEGIPPVEITQEDETLGAEEVLEEPAIGANVFGAFAFGQLTANHTTPVVLEDPIPEARAPIVRKIEKSHPEQNGVKRPSPGTVCARVWDLTASMSEVSEFGIAHSKIATLSQVIKAAEALGINKFTARTQYARWRVFNGLTGRLA